MKEISEPRQKTKLELGTLPDLIPSLSNGFGVVVKINGSNWVKWYRATTQATYTEIVNWARGHSIHDHDVILYSASV
jgi:hypothetical protein